MKHSAYPQPRAVLACVGLAFSITSLIALNACARKENSQKSGSELMKAVYSANGSVIGTGVPTATPLSLTDAVLGLESLAREQLVTPDARTVEKSGVSAGGVSAFERTIRAAQEAHPSRANITIQDALASFAPSAWSPSKSGPAVALTPAQQLDRTKLYVAGKERLVAGDARGALSALESVVTFDEQSGDAAALAQSLGLLAEAQMLAGNRSSGSASYQRAVDLGLDDPRVHAYLGRELLRGKEYAEAIARLLRAGMLARDSEKELTLAVAETDLADALLSLGYVRASGELLTRVLTSLPESPSTALRAEDAELYRRRAELWRRAGDLAVARGDTAAAQQAFAQAAGMPGVDTAELLERSTRTLLAQGQSAQAALVSLGLLAPGAMTRIGETPGQPKAVTIAAGARLLTPLLTSGAGPALERVLLAIVQDSATAPGVATSLTLTTARAAVTLPENTRGEHVLFCQSLLIACIVRQPDSPPVFNALLDTYAPGAGNELATVVSQLCTFHPAYAPMFAQELTLHGVATTSVLARARTMASSDCGAWMLTSLLESLLDLPTSVPRPRACGPETEPAPGSLLVSTIVAMRRGDWAGARAASAAIAADRGFFKALSLGESGLQSSDAALAALPSEVARGQDSLTFFQAAQLALAAGDAGRAEAFLLAAKAADPTDERVYEQLLSLYAPKGPRADETQVAMLAKDLRENVPDSAFGVLISARDSLSRQRYSAAADGLVPLFDRTPIPTGAYNLAVTIATASYSVDPSISVRMLTFIDKALQKRPQAPMLLTAKARLLALPALLDDRTDKAADPQSPAQRGASAAEQLLADTYVSLPMRELARVREQIVAEALDNPARAAELRLQRLERAQRDIDLIIEYARTLTARGDLNAAALAINDELPKGELTSIIPLTSTQRSRLRALSLDLTPANLRDVSPEAVIAAPALLDALEARISPLPREAAVARIVLLCMADTGDAQRVLDAVKKAVAADPELKAAIVSSVPQLLARRNSAEAISMIGVLAQDPDIGSPSLLFEWFRAVFFRGDETAIRTFIKEIKDPLTTLQDIAGESEIELGPDSSDEVRRAELAYWVGNAASSIQREQAAEAAYRIALEYQPDHPWTLNNLGYNLLESGKNMEEATTMIERAAAALPEEPSVLDSLGWLRYRQGDFASATELIQKAVDHEASNDSAEKFLHLGDALWRLGRTDDAISAWERGSTEIQNRLQLIRAQRPARVPNQPAAEMSPAEKRAVSEERALVARLGSAREKRPVGVTATQAERSAPGGNEVTPVAQRKE